RFIERIPLLTPYLGCKPCDTVAINRDPAPEDARMGLEHPPGSPVHQGDGCRPQGSRRPTPHGGRPISVDSAAQDEPITPREGMGPPKGSATGRTRFVAERFGTPTDPS